METCTRKYVRGDMDAWAHGHMETWTWRPEHGDMELKYWEILTFCEKYQLEIEVQTILLNLFTVCSSCKRKFVVCPFVDEETNGSYLFAIGLNGLNRLAHLWLLEFITRMHSWAEDR
jgi:hypothetical protein